MARHNLLVDVRQLAACIFEEECALDHVNGGKDIHEQHGNSGQDHVSVLVVQNEAVGDEKFEFAHEPETEGKQDGNGDDQRVGNH